MPIRDNTISGLPQLDVPSPAIARHPDTEVKPARLQSWIMDLPFADPLKVAKELLSQLRLQVRDPDPGKHFSERLKAFHRVLHDIDSRCRQTTLRHPCLSPERELDGLTSRLLLELANGHMRAVNLMIGRQQEPLAVDLYHGMFTLSRLIQTDLLQYNLTRPGIWRQILQLFHIAEFYRKTEETTQSALAAETDPDNIHGLFFSTLALLLCDPHRLTPSQQFQVSGMLTQCSSYLRFSTLGTEDGIPVDVSGSKPPLALARSHIRDDRSRLLVLDDCLTALERADDDQGDSLIRQWLRSSLNSLRLGNPADDRAAQRFRRSAVYRCIEGLYAVQQRLSELSAQAAAGHDPWGTPEDDHLYANTLEPGTTCEQINHSVTGAAFLIHASVANIQVGQILLFESTESLGASATGFAARIRRLLQRDNGLVEVGVEKLQGSLLPVALNRETRALLQVNRRQHLFMLHAPKRTFRPHGTLALETPQKTHPVRMLALEEENPYELIRVELQEQL